MGKIILVPIEPLEERYSADWLRWFEEELPSNTIIINPAPLTSVITCGSFLDVCGTNYYKAMQLARISRMIFNGEIQEKDTFLFLDLWFPGLESLAYMRDALDIKFKITGCLHAGTYDRFDFLSKKGMGKWGKDLENSWFEIADQIFVATKFHKQLICKNRNVNSFKIKVTGFPIYPLQKEHNIPDKVKKNIVVFPHRLDSEKNPHLFDKLAERLQLTFSNWSFVKAKDLKLSKQDYYELLCSAKISVSFADQETWGIAMQESVLAGCVPIVPDRLAYPEMYPKCFRYNDFEDCVEKVAYYINDVKGIDSYITYKNIVDCGLQAIPNILQELQND